MFFFSPFHWEIRNSYVEFYPLLNSISFLLGCLLLYSGGKYCVSGDMYCSVMTLKTAVETIVLICVLNSIVWWLGVEHGDFLCQVWSLLVFCVVGWNQFPDRKFFRTYSNLFKNLFQEFVENLPESFIIPVINDSYPVVD